MSKNSDELCHAGDHRERGEHDGHRAAQPGPASTARSARAKAEASVDDHAASGRATRTSDDRQHGALDARRRPAALGNTSRPSARNIVELRDPRQPLMERVIVLLGGDRRAAEHEPGDVDGEEARAVQRVGGAERERRGRERRDGVEAGGRELRALERPAPRRADREPDDGADPDCAHEQLEHVGDAVVGLLDPVDEADHQQHRDRVVDAGLALERAREPALAASSRAAARRSPRRRSTRGSRRAAGPRAS